MRLLFGAYEPDKPEHLTDTLVTAKNVYATANGYQPVKAPEHIADALTGTFLGGGAFVASDGTVMLMAGDGTDLYEYTSGAWSSLIGTLTVNTFWQFAQFGDDVIAVNGGAPISVDLLLGTAAALSGTPPTADLVAVNRDFVVLGRADGDANVVQWSDIGDAENWTTGLSGAQPMYDGGKIMGLTSGEYTLILQRFRIVRMTYTGDASDPFQFDAISTNYGCVAEKTVAQAGDLVFCLSDRGFIMIQAGGITPIGAERVDRTFRNTYSLGDLRNMWATVDPQRTVVFWVIQNKVWCYNWTIDRWFTWEFSISAAFPSFTESMSIEELGVLYGDLESIPLSLDDPEYSGGAPRLTIVGGDGQFKVLNGTNLEAEIEMAVQEPFPTRRARIRRVRPMCDAVDGMTLTLAHSERLGDSFDEDEYTDYRASGTMPTRTGGRYIRPKLKIAAGTDWSYLQGLELEGEAGGMR